MNTSRRTQALTGKPQVRNTECRDLFPRKRSDDELVTKTELNHELNTVRDKIDARFLTLSEKIETVGASIHTRLNKLDAGLARVDERTKK